jgi:hypothetical protein
VFSNYFPNLFNFRFELLVNFNLVEHWFLHILLNQVTRRRLSVQSWIKIVDNLELVVKTDYKQIISREISLTNTIICGNSSHIQFTENLNYLYKPSTSWLRSYPLLDNFIVGFSITQRDNTVSNSVIGQTNLGMLIREYSDSMEFFQSSLCLRSK